MYAFLRKTKNMNISYVFFFLRRKAYMKKTVPDSIIRLDYNRVGCTARKNAKSNIRSVELERSYDWWKTQSFIGHMRSRDRDKKPTNNFKHYFPSYRMEWAIISTEGIAPGNSQSSKLLSNYWFCFTLQWFENKLFIDKYMFLYSSYSISFLFYVLVSFVFSNLFLFFKKKYLKKWKLLFW